MKNKNTAMIFAALGSLIATTYFIDVNASATQPATPAAPTDQTSSQSTQPQPKDPAQVCIGKSEGDSCTTGDMTGSCKRNQNGQLSCTK